MPWFLPRNVKDFDVLGEEPTWSSLRSRFRGGDHEHVDGWLCAK